MKQITIKEQKKWILKRMKKIIWNLEHTGQESTALQLKKSWNLKCLI